MSAPSIATLEPVFRVFERLLCIPVVPVTSGGIPCPGYDPPLPLCRLLQSNGPGRDRCLAGCYREASRARCPGLFRCHAGLTGFVFPIRTDDASSIGVAGGPVALRTPDPAFYLSLAEEQGLPADAVIEAACALPIGSEEEVLGKGRGLSMLAEAQIAASLAGRASREIADGAISLFSALEGVGAADGFSDLAGYLTDIISMVFSVDRVVLARPDSAGRFRCQTVTGEDQDACAGLLIDPAAQPYAEGLASGRPFVVTSQRRLIESGFPHDIRLLTAVPVGHGGEVRGLILLLDARLGPARLRLLSSFAGMVGMAIANCELRGQSFSRRQRLERLLTLAREGGLVEPSEEGGTIEPYLGRLTDLLEAERASVMTLDRDPGTMTVRLRKATSPGVMTFTVPSAGSVVAPVLQGGAPLIVRGPAEDGARLPFRRRYRTGSFVSTPLVIGGRVKGAVNVADPRDGGHFDDVDLALLLVVSHQVAHALEREAWRSRSRRLTKLSMTDPLTGLLNRRYFSQRLDEEVERCRRLEEPLSFLMVDIDHFKNYNDRNGHVAGDDALRLVAGAIKASIRSVDLAARYGGEEFAVILPFTDRSEAVAVAERLRGAVEGSGIPLAALQPGGRLTVSVGVRAGQDGGADSETLVAEADRALYRAKQEGRNRIVVHS